MNANLKSVQARSEVRKLRKAIRPFNKQLKKDLILKSLPVPLFYKGLLPIKAGSFKMSPIHVKDIAKIFIKSLSMKESIENIYELGGKEKTWKGCKETFYIRKFTTKGRSIFCSSFFNF